VPPGDPAIVQDNYRVLVDSAAHEWHAMVGIRRDLLTSGHRQLTTDLSPLLVINSSYKTHGRIDSACVIDTDTSLLAAMTKR